MLEGSGVECQVVETESAGHARLIAGNQLYEL